MTNPTTPDWLPRAIELRREGKTYDEIGGEIGQSASVVGKTFISLNINIPRLQKVAGPAPWAERAKAMRRQKLSWKDISAALGVGTHNIRCEIDPGFKERKSRQNREYMDRDGWAVRRERERKAKEVAAVVEPAPKRNISADVLAAGRFCNLADQRAGR